MDSKVVFEGVAPVIPVRNLAAALERYRHLGFAARRSDEDPGYGFVARGPVSLHLTEWNEHDPARTAAAVYIYVSDADALHAEWVAANVTGRLGEPHDTPYGLREFGYVDPDGTLHRVGSPMP
ncbi:bleomycin resistance protein [Microbispora triticiradicis]|uniref:Bleomycin resistance protein n=2 Tax=Microbispora TaxID=2005 RepID=A0ABY3M655_9ACTN|nr:MULTISPECIES: VOC family protein [Microbispora]TLP66395.1 VOC family protein [Microbispora fusca]TYB68179.1 VOC family protein [Microbispora tritici]